MIYETVWSGAIDRVARSVVVMDESGHKARVRQMTPDRSALLPPRASRGAGWYDSRYYGEKEPVRCPYDDATRLRVKMLAFSGQTEQQILRATHIPRSTVRSWLGRRPSHR